MRQGARWAVVVLLYCGAGDGWAEDTREARLREARTQLDAAQRLKAEGDYDQALARAQEALTLREAELGSAHPEVARCLEVMGTLQRLRGKLDLAEPLLQRALAIREAALGGSHPDVASSLNSLASLHATRGAYDLAEPLLQRALAIREAVLGANHLDVAASLNSLANLRAEQGAYGQAEPLYQRSLAIREAALGANHPDVASSLDNLAILYREQGWYDRAEPLFDRALAIREAALGAGHPDVATSLNNLAVLYNERGLYARAEPLYRRALDIRRAALGDSHPDVAASLNNLAILYLVQGDYGRAEPLFQRALALQEAALGRQHPDVAVLLMNLATLYARQERYGRAEPLFLRALEAQEAARGSDHFLVALLLGDLAALYGNQGQYTRAESLYRRALALHEAALGPEHFIVANSLNDLAELYLSQGLPRRAEPLFQRALAIREASLGEDHPGVATALKGLARSRVLRRRLSEALPLFTRALSLSERRLRQEALGFSESRLASFLQQLRADEEQLYALLRAHPEDARVRHLALGAALLLKGRSAEETAQISRTVHRGLDAPARAAFERLRGLRTQLTDLALKGPGALAPARYRQRREELAAQGDALEAEVAGQSASLRALTALPPLEAIVGRVAASLPEDGALVEFIVSAEGLHSGTPRYLALVLFSDATTRAVDLGPAEILDAAASRLREALAHREPTYSATARRLERLVFQPLRPLLAGRRRLFVVPEGQLNLVPFDALHDGRGFLLDSFDFTYLTSGHELLPRSGGAVSSSVVVLADPDFAAAPPPSTPLTNSDALERFYSSWRSPADRASWARLPGSRVEAEGIQRLWPQARLFLGTEATKERLLGLPTPGLLHLATHGFFLGSTPASVGQRDVMVTEGGGGPPSPQQEPLLNSGLVLTGARAPAPDAAAPRADATLVTALELAGLDLWGTQLVVLSACDTARGDVRLGQGVYGLRRALVVAGAETVITSLWKIDDGSTPRFMETYYRNLLAGQGKASALRGVMRSLRASQLHPHDWAPFIAMGRDAPLRDIVPAASRPPTP